MNECSKYKECWPTSWINIKEKATDMWTITFKKSRRYILKKKRRKRKEWLKTKK